MAKKTLVFGSNGMLGHYVVGVFKQAGMDVIPLTRKDFDIACSNISSKCIIDFLARHNVYKGDVVVNCAGVIPQSTPSGITFEQYMRINGIFPILLGDVCKTIGCRCIHVTTDCVYDGQAGAPYDETSLCSPITTYGLTKLVGEKCDGTVIRTSIIGEQFNTKSSLLEWVRSHPSGAHVQGYTNHIWNGVTCLQLAKIIRDVIVQDLYWGGIRHVFSPEAVSKYELLCMINQVYALGLCIHAVEADTKIDRRLTSCHTVIEAPSLIQQLHDLRNYSHDTAL